MNIYSRKFILGWFGFGLALLLLALLAGCGSIPPIIIDPGEEEVHQPSGTKKIGFKWTAPCTTAGIDSCGTPAVEYVLEVKPRGGDWDFRMVTPDTFARVTLQPGTWQVRVAARDSALHQGPFSEASNPVRIPVPQDDDLPDIHNPLGEGPR